MEDHPTKDQNVRIVIVDVPEQGTLLNGKFKLPVARVNGKGLVLFVEDPPRDVAVGNVYQATVTKLLARSGFCRVVKDGSALAS